MNANLRWTEVHSMGVGGKSTHGGSQMDKDGR